MGHERETDDDDRGQGHVKPVTQSQAAVGSVVRLKATGRRVNVTGVTDGMLAVISDDLVEASVPRECFL